MLTELIPEGRHSEVTVTAPKGNIGHTFCAAGGIETAIAAKSITEQISPPIRNLENILREGEKLHFSRKYPESQVIRHALKTTFAFGGINVALILSRVE